MNPETPEGQQFAQRRRRRSGGATADDAEQQMQFDTEQALEAQRGWRGGAEGSATLMNGQLKEQINAMKAQATAEIESLKTQLQAAKDAAKQSFDYDKLKTDTALKLTELETNSKMQLERELQANKESLNGSGRSASEGSEKGQASTKGTVSN